MGSHDVFSDGLLLLTVKDSHDSRSAADSGES